MRDLLPQRQEESLLSRISGTKDSSSHPLANHLIQMGSPDSLQGLALSRTQGSIKTFSSTVMPSSNLIVRGRSQNRPYMSKSSLDLPGHSVTTGKDQMLPSDHSLQLSKATIWKLKQQQPKEELSTRCSTPPALLYQIQMDNTPKGNQVPRGSKSMSQHLHGLLVGNTNVPFCKTHSPKLSNSLSPTPSIQRQRSNPLLTNWIALNSQIQSGRTSSPDEQSALTQSLADSSP